MVATFKPNTLRAATAILSLAALLILGNGFYNLVFVPDWKGDLHKRWLEQRCVSQGKNPYTVYEASTQSLKPAIEPGSANLATRDADLEQIHPGGYPPWSFLTGFLFAPPISFSLVRIWFALLNLAAIAFISWWAFQMGRTIGPEQGFFLVAATLAVFAHAVSLRLGQYGILINALLIGMLIREHKSQGVLEGLMLGVAAIKPNIAALFFLVLLVRRRFAIFGVASGYVFLAALIVAAAVRTGPFHMLRQMFQQTAEWDLGDAGLVRLALQIGMPRSWVTFGGLALGLGVCAVLLYKYRSRSLTVLFAIPAVVGRLWMYHRRYDDVMLVFLLVPLGVLALRRPTQISLGIFLLVGISLWMPLRDSDQTAVVILVKVFIWIIGLWHLLRNSKPVVSGLNEESQANFAQ